jgi:hypothetical protein
LLVKAWNVMAGACSAILLMSPSSRHAVLSDDVPLVVSRQVLQLMAQEVSKLPPEAHKAVAS